MTDRLPGATRSFLDNDLESLGGKPGGSVFRVFAMPPLIPAVLSIVPMWLGLMPRYDVIYIPVLTDLYIFAFTYIIFGVLNAVVIAPICIFVASRVSSPLVGVGLAFAGAVFGTFVALAANRSEAHVVFLFLALFLTTSASFYYVAQHRRSVLDVPRSGA